MDYLEIVEKDRDINKLTGCFDDLEKLHRYYNEGQITLLKEHIQSIANKYFIETAIWNIANPYTPCSIGEAYRNAVVFLQSQCKALIIKISHNYAQMLSGEEMASIASIKQYIQS